MSVRAAAAAAAAAAAVEVVQLQEGGGVGASRCPVRNERVALHFTHADATTDLHSVECYNFSY